MLLVGGAPGEERKDRRVEGAIHGGNVSIYNGVHLLESVSCFLIEDEGYASKADGCRTASCKAQRSTIIDHHRFMVGEIRSGFFEVRTNGVGAKDGSRAGVATIT